MTEFNVLFLPGLYNEALLLLAQTHDYFHREAELEQEAMDNRERTMFASEMSRITVRLSSVMTWLMARRAALEGKISPTDAREHYRLDCKEVCLNQHIEAESLLPDRMTELLDSSFELYRRVARLDDNEEKE